MKRPYQITGLVMFLFAAYIVYQSLELSYYTALGPGAGFFPFWLAILMMVLSAIMFAQATFTQTSPMPSNFYASRTGYLRAAAVIVAVLWMVRFLDALGFRLVMAGFFSWLLLSLGRLPGARGWVTIVAVTIAGSWGAFWLFNDMLKVPLPIGTFGF